MNKTELQRNIESGPEAFHAEDLTFVELQEALKLASHTFLEEDMGFQTIKGEKISVVEIDEEYTIHGLGALNRTPQETGQRLPRFKTAKDAKNSIKMTIQQNGGRIVTE